MGVLKVWDGTAWQFISAASDGASVYVGPDPPPGTPDTGDMWFDSDEDGTTGTTLPLTVADGGTGATNAAAARSSLAVPAVGQSGSTAGAPTTGTWARGDQWLDSANVMWTCVTAGTPGTWTSPYGGPWTAFTPNFTNGTTSWTPGAVSMQGRYRKLSDKTVLLKFHMAPGAGTSFTSGIIYMDPPAGLVPDVSIYYPVSGICNSAFGGASAFTGYIYLNHTNSKFGFTAPPSTSASNVQSIGSTMGLSNLDAMIIFETV